jgi:hypothetical protein
MRITCDHCGKDRMPNEAHMPERQRGMVLRVLLGRMRHDCSGGRQPRWITDQHRRRVVVPRAQGRAAGRLGRRLAAHHG